MTRVSIQRHLIQCFLKTVICDQGYRTSRPEWCLPKHLKMQTFHKNNNTHCIIFTCFYCIYFKIVIQKLFCFMQLLPNRISYKGKLLLTIQKIKINALIPFDYSALRHPDLLPFATLNNIIPNIKVHSFQKSDMHCRYTSKTFFPDKSIFACFAKML